MLCLLAPVVSQVSDVPYFAIAASNQMNLQGLVEPFEIAISLGGESWILAILWGPT